MDTFLLYGPPGSGKTTVGMRLSERASLDYVSVGEITRNLIREQDFNALGRELFYYHSRSLQYPNSLILAVVKKAIVEGTRENGRVLLDGYPKYPDEIDGFNEILAETNGDVRGIVRLTLPLPVARERINDRRMRSNAFTQRWEDNDIDLERRYRDHMDAVDFVIGRLGSFCSRLVEIDAIQPLEEVLYLIESFIDAKTQ